MKSKQRYISFAEYYDQYYTFDIFYIFAYYYYILNFLQVDKTPRSNRKKQFSYSF